MNTFLSALKASTIVILAILAIAVLIVILAVTTVLSIPVWIVEVVLAIIARDRAYLEMKIWGGLIRKAIVFTVMAVAIIIACLPKKGGKK